MPRRRKLWPGLKSNVRAPSASDAASERPQDPEHDPAPVRQDEVGEDPACGLPGDASCADGVAPSRAVATDEPVETSARVRAPRPHTAARQVRGWASASEPPRSAGDDLDEDGEVRSPCTGLCAVSSTGRCPGCGRTLMEIATWTSLPPDEKRAVRRRAAARLG